MSPAVVLRQCQRMACGTMTTLPDFDSLWDYNHPAETERRFRELLPVATSSADRSYCAQLLTQIARTLGLQRRFDES